MTRMTRLNEYLRRAKNPRGYRIDYLREAIIELGLEVESQQAKINQLKAVIARLEQAAERRAEP